MSIKELDWIETWDLMTDSCKSPFSTPAEGFCDTYLADNTLVIIWYTSEGGNVISGMCTTPPKVLPTLL